MGQDTMLTLKTLTTTLLRISAAAGELQRPIVDGVGQSAERLLELQHYRLQGHAVELGQSLAEFVKLAGLDARPIAALFAPDQAAEQSAPLASENAPRLVESAIDASTAIEEAPEDVDLEDEHEDDEAEETATQVLTKLREHAPGEYWVPMDWLEAAYFDHALQLNEGEKDATGDDLGLARSTVYRKMRRHQLPWSDDDRIDEDERLLRKRARSRALELTTKFAQAFPELGASIITIEQLENMYLKAAMRAFDDDIQRVAQVLGIARSTVYRKLKKMEG